VQVQEVMEQLLLQGDLLLDMSAEQLPPSCSAARFLTSLGEALAAEPAMGSVIRWVGAERGEAECGLV
jgi:hypothetical protein